MFWDEKDEKSSLPDLPPLKASPGFPTREEEDVGETRITIGSSKWHYLFNAKRKFRSN